MLSGEALIGKLLKALPFQLTGAQQRVIGEIRADLARQHPMLRLIQGDVGSGKTLVAAAAALVAIESGYQVALMAPTELLAEQHLANFRHWLAPLGIDVHWLAGSVGAKARRETLAALAEGHGALVVGTHALFQDAVVFQRLGLIIIDGSTLSACGWHCAKKAASAIRCRTSSPSPPRRFRAPWR